MTQRLLLAACTALTALPAWEHEGHGLPGTAHWHSTDVVGCVVLSIGVAAALWFVRRK